MIMFGSEENHGRRYRTDRGMVERERALEIVRGNFEPVKGVEEWHPQSLRADVLHRHYAL
jgi:hypothetical protein